MMSFLGEAGIVSIVFEEVESCAGAWNVPLEGQLISDEWRGQGNCGIKG